MANMEKKPICVCSSSVQVRIFYCTAAAAKPVWLRAASVLGLNHQADRANSFLRVRLIKRLKEIAVYETSMVLCIVRGHFGWWNLSGSDSRGFDRHQGRREAGGSRSVCGCPGSRAWRLGPT